MHIFNFNLRKFHFVFNLISPAALHCPLLPAGSSPKQIFSHREKNKKN